jgi:orotidine-5'-phosphate decarboxylase
MARAAVEGARQAGTTKILGVTVLSSLDAEACREIGLAQGPDDTAIRLAKLGAGAGLHGVVCSPREAAALRAALPPPHLIVTPGIRPRGSPADDQARAATAAEAIAAGADLLVVGRPVIAAPDPAATLQALIRELGG